MEKLYREQILTLPNGITIIRVIAIPIILIMLFSPNQIHRLVTALFFFAVAITDTLDGYRAKTSFSRTESAELGFQTSYGRKIGDILRVDGTRGVVEVIEKTSPKSV